MSPTQLWIDAVWVTIDHCHRSSLDCHRSRCIDLVQIPLITLERNTPSTEQDRSLKIEPSLLPSISSTTLDRLTLNAIDLLWSMNIQDQSQRRFSCTSTRSIYVHDQEALEISDMSHTIQAQQFLKPNRVMGKDYHQVILRSVKESDQYISQRC